MFGHMTDVGGKVPGSLPTDATTIFEEGVARATGQNLSRGALQDDMLTLVLQPVPAAALEPQRLQRDRRGLPHRRAPRDRDVRPLRGRHLRLRRWKPRSSATSARCAADPDARSRKRRLVFEDYVCDDGRGHGPVQDALHDEARRRASDPRLRRAPIRSRTARSTSISTKTCSRCSSAST